jgi:cobalt-zinc-cadmium efflux system protein
MEGVPAEIDLSIVEEALLKIPGVTAVHDLHVWTVTSGMDSLTGHLVITDMNDARIVLKSARTILEEKFNIDHITIQVEDAEMRAAEPVLRI